MLFVTTRNDREVYTVQHPLNQSRGPDGGLFLPFHNPVFSVQELESLKESSFNQTTAMVLNRIFGTKLTQWDLDFTIGRYPVRFQQIRHRILLGETWHNPEWTFDRTLRLLSQKLGAGDNFGSGSWVQIGIRIAVLFGLYAELIRGGVLQTGEKMDVSLVSGDFSGPISAWYARLWGLPVGNIICCCNENSELWNLICHGQFRTDVLSISTETPEADIALPVNLERLIHGCGGTAEVHRYLECCQRGGMYLPSERVLASVRTGLFVSVISGNRMAQTIPGAYTTHGCLLSPYGALAYAGLLDYRAKTGQLRPGVVISEKSPVCDAETVSRCMGITEEKLRKML